MNLRLRRAVAARQGLAKLCAVVTAHDALDQSVCVCQDRLSCAVVTALCARAVVTAHDALPQSCILPGHGRAARW